MEEKNIRAEEISLHCLLRTLKKNLWMMIASALIFAMAVSLYADFGRKPVYRASMTYAVTSRLSTYSTRNITAAKEMASILTQVLDNEIVNETIRNSSEELKNYSGGISAQLIENSNFVVVVSESSSPRVAFQALVALKDNFDTIADYISSNIIAQVIQEPTATGLPVNSINVRSAAIKAAVAGFVLMAAAITALTVTSETVQTREGARHLIDAPILAVLGHERSGKRKKQTPVLITSPTVSFAYTENIRSICSRLEHEKRERGSNIILVTSVGANEGKSTVAANIAISLAARGNKLALMDADLRNPTQADLFGGRWSSPLPLNKMLARPFSVEALNTCAKYDRETGVMMLFSGESDQRSTELLSSETMRMTIERLRRLDFVIIDTPPMGMFPDAELLCDEADISLLVVRQNVISAPDINDAVDALGKGSARFIGCVLNDMQGGSGGYGYGYGYGRYGYGYGKKYGYGKGYGYSQYGYGKDAKSAERTKG